MARFCVSCAALSTASLSCSYCVILSPFSNSARRLSRLSCGRHRPKICTSDVRRNAVQFGWRPVESLRMSCHRSNNGGSLVSHGVVVVGFVSEQIGGIVKAPLRYLHKKEVDTPVGQTSEQTEPDILLRLRAFVFQRCEKFRVLPILSFRPVVWDVASGDGSQVRDAEVLHEFNQLRDEVLLENKVQIVH